MLIVRDITHWSRRRQRADRINFTLNRGESAGLIGPNGSGKTTLLRSSRASSSLTGATSRCFASACAGYLAQALEFGPGATVGDVLAAAEGEREAAEARRLARLAGEMATAAEDAFPAAMAAYDRALAEFQALGGGGQAAPMPRWCWPASAWLR